jgi:hypothetical protein
MIRLGSWAAGARRLSLILAIGMTGPSPADAQSQPAPDRPFDGLNVVATPGQPFGSEPAKRALSEVSALGARAIAIVPFFWQSSSNSPDLGRGRDMTDSQLRAAIRDAHALGLAAVVKPHVWVPHSWAGVIAMDSDDDWQKWFANYRRELDRIAGIAEEENAELLAIGTELSKTTQRQEWGELVDAMRRAYRGHLIYFAHNIEEAETVPFWNRLDAIGVTLYPPLGADCDRDGRRMTMREVADRLDALAARTGQPIVVGEIGLRSAQGAAAKPWESAEERATIADPALQAQVLHDWLDILDRPSIQGVLIWRWLTDPDAGGLSDTDFTVQGKPAERVLMCAWTRSCDRDHQALSTP